MLPSMTEQELLILPLKYKKGYAISMIIPGCRIQEHIYVIVIYQYMGLKRLSKQGLL